MSHTPQRRDRVSVDHEADRVVDVPPRRRLRHGREPRHGRSDAPGAAWLEQLDYLYTPSTDVAADVSWYRDALGARVVFAIESSGTRVAMLELTSAPPRVLLADHLDGERPVLVYRVADLEAAMASLASRGWEPERTLEDPRWVRVPPSAPLAATGSPSTSAAGPTWKRISPVGWTSEPPRLA